MLRRTKIVCTLGPAVDSRERIGALIRAGMNVARINCSHGDWEIRRRWIEWVRELSPNLGPIGVLVDLQGPKFRIGELPSGSKEINPGESIVIGEESGLFVPHPEVLRVLAKGDRVLLGDGNVELRIVSASRGKFEAQAVSGGTIKSKQGITVVGKAIPCEAITEKDKRDVVGACKLGADFIALSYVRRPEDIAALKTLIARRDSRIQTCAKIETREALGGLDGIVRESDIVMVARGDLGLQMDIEEVPLAQKRIIRKCNEAGKPVITATQMLESMISSPRPTRAEAADVANAILDGTDAVMLSGETAAGEYPVEAVSIMARIASQAETMFDHAALMRRFLEERTGKSDPTEAIAHAATQLADLTSPAAILTTTTTGQTARLVSKYRPTVPILCATWDEKTQAQMSVVWGVEAAKVPKPSSTDESVRQAVDEFRRSKRLKNGERVIVTAGVPTGTPGMTNLILNQVVE